MSAQVTLERAYFEDQARPIGSGWRWVFVLLGRKWALICDPYNRYTVRIPLRSKDPRRGWSTVACRDVQPEERALMLRSAKKRLGQLMADAGDAPTRFEAMCLAVK